MPERILIVDDDPAVQSALFKALNKRGYEIAQATSAEAALERVKEASFDLVILDVRLPGMSGMDAIPHLRQIDPRVVIIVITGHDSKELASTAIRNGAYDYFPKPFSYSEIEIVIKRALEKRRLRAEAEALRERLLGMAAGRLIGHSEPMRAVLNLVERVAPLETTVLLTGESGTGKELVADLIHYRSGRAAGPFVKINCAAIPEALLESELFGFEKGAFTGAHGSKPGKFEMAQHGTILLDEVGDMPLSTQVKILRVVEHKQVERLGGRDPVAVDGRIIAATNQELLSRIEEKKFREDLYFRLNVASIHIPPLRERKEDLPLLIHHFLNEINGKMGTTLHGLTQEATEIILRHPWPGNVRELANVLERSAIMSRGDILTAEDLRSSFHRPPSGAGPPGSNDKPASLWQTVQEVEKSLIIDALRRADGIQTEAAKGLGLSPKNLWKKIRKHRIDVRNYSQAG
jgi:two-component system, NtrC family, response regulator AtoC